MIRVVLIGSGNVSRHLFEAFRASEAMKLIQVVGRNPKGLAYFQDRCQIGAFSDIYPDADIYIIAVSDDAIDSVSQQLNLNSKLVVHTAGGRPAALIDPRHRRGVLYPLQTFSKDRELVFREVPLCIEAEHEADLVLLRKVACCLSEHVEIMPYAKRKQLHLAAVLANNFTNHLYHLAHDHLKGESLPFELLLPLIRETSNKLEQMTPREAQTGPARRGDRNTIEQHQTLLKTGMQKEIYALLSKSIQQTYAKNI